MTIPTDFVTDYAEKFYVVLIDYTPRLISALIILFVGLYVIRLVNRFVRRLMKTRQHDPTLSNFLADILLWAMRVMLFVTFISRLGVETSSFVAILGAAGLAVGLSLQGSLSNFAGGMLIILFKPFRVGDAIEAQGVIGTVAEIQIFVTKLINANNQTIFVPNGALSNGNIINYSLQGTRRADLNFTVSYKTDLKMVKEIILDVMKKDPRILESPEASVEIVSLVDNGVRIAVRPWATNKDFWDVYSDTLENTKFELFKAGIDLQPYVVEASLQR